MPTARDVAGFRELCRELYGAELSGDDATDLLGRLMRFVYLMGETDEDREGGGRGWSEAAVRRAFYGEEQEEPGSADAPPQSG